MRSLMMTMCELRLATLVDLHNIYTYRPTCILGLIFAPGCSIITQLCVWWHYGQFGFVGMSIKIGSEIFKFQMELKFEVTTNVNIV